MDTLAERLKWARETAGLSQRGLSELAGLASSHVQLIESGRAEGLNLGTAGGLAQALGLSLDWLSGRDQEPPSALTIRAAVERARASVTILRDASDFHSQESDQPSREVA